MKRSVPPLIGKHTLETLTTGMYKNPFDALREYVQNSADSIDNALKLTLLQGDEGEVTIQIDPRARSILIRDNGTGLSRRQATLALRSVGSSEKLGRKSRGFRGIGRLGGLGYCDELVFRTKCQAEPREFVQKWNAVALREQLRSKAKDHRGMAEVIDEVSVEFVEDTRDREDAHFFEVLMTGVHEERLLDNEAVVRYLGETVPVPFDFQAFSYGQEIDQYLRRTVPAYASFRIMVNSDIIYKLYQDTVALSRAPNRQANAESQRIKQIDYLTICGHDDELLARGWLGITDLKGTISPDSGVSGVRFRSGNMLVGDGTALEAAFQKSNRRFATYLIGEIHAVHEGLVPNARRDDFESNATRLHLMEAIARQIGQPATEEIRKASRSRSQDKKVKCAERLRTDAEKEIHRGLVSEGRRSELTEGLTNSLSQLNPENPKQAAESRLIEATADRIAQDAANVVDIELQSNFGKPTRDVLKQVFEMVYEDYQDKKRADRLIRKIVATIKSA